MSAPGERHVPVVVRRRAWLLLAIALIAVAARWSVGVHTIDDAYITFRYAQNLAAGRGFCYNPPERVLGTSTPLFTLMLAPAAAWGLNLEHVAFVVSMAADLVTIAATAALLVDAGYPLGGLVTALLLAVSPSYIEYSVSGMETSLYVALIMATLWAFARDRWTLCGVGLGLLAVCRPDGALLSAVLGGVMLARRPLAAVRMLVPASVVVLPWLLFAFWYFGSPLPTSVVAKWALARDPLASVRVIEAIYFAGPWLPLTLLSAAGVWRLWRRGDLSTRVWVGWAVVYTSVFTIARAFNHFLWYFMPILPLYLAGVGALSDATPTRIGRRVMAPVRHLLGRAVVTVTAITVIVGVPVRLWRLQERLDARLGERERLYASVATRLAAISRDCALAATEIGALGYHYRGPILDLVGLISPEAIGRPDDALRDSQVCWLVTYDDHLRGLDPSIERAVWFRRTFSAIETHLLGPGRSLVVYRKSRQGQVISPRG